MRKYYIHDGKIENGPFDIEQLSAMEIKIETPIWYEGLQSWTVAGNVEELKPILVTNYLPPKFDNIAHQNSDIQPPAFQNKIVTDNLSNKPKKSKTVRNILIGLGILFIVILISNLIFSQPNEAEQTLMDYESESINKEIERGRINAEITEKNKNYRNNWSDYISVNTNEYTFYEIGGVENLQIIATNISEYKIDEVTVNVCYETDAGSCYKTEEVTIYNIPANSQKSEYAPNSSRGKNIILNIVGIYSDKMNFAYAPGNWANNSDDPYFTKEKK